MHRGGRGRAPATARSRVRAVLQSSSSQECGTTAPLNQVQAYDPCRNAPMPSSNSMQPSPSPTRTHSPPLPTLKLLTVGSSLVHALSDNDCTTRRKWIAHQQERVGCTTALLAAPCSEAVLSHALCCHTTSTHTRDAATASPQATHAVTPAAASRGPQPCVPPAALT